MKEPIEVDDIRKGDAIRWERSGPQEGYILSAAEYVTTRDCQPYFATGGQHYLIEPRKPAVELPEDPTLGWITIAGEQLFGKFSSCATGENVVNEYDIPGRIAGSWMNVTAFTPATPIPTEALDELRAAVNGRLGCPDVAIHEATLNLLTAVDGES